MSSKQNAANKRLRITQENLDSAKRRGARDPEISRLTYARDQAKLKASGAETDSDRVRRKDKIIRDKGYYGVILSDSVVDAPVLDKPTLDTINPQKDKSKEEDNAIPVNTMTLKDAITINDPPDIGLGYNVLDNYSNYSYKFRLYMINELDLKPEKSLTPDLDGIDKVIIAETGATSFYIDSVNFDSKVATNGESLNAITSKFDMTIIEPLGASLFDKFSVAASTLGVRNYAQQPFYLELTFTGYDGFGKPNNDILKNEKKVWKVVIRNTEMNVSEKGAEYTILGSLINEIGIFQEYGSLPTSISVKGNTMPKILAKLQKEWNDAEEKKWGISQAPLKQYEIVLYNDYRDGGVQWATKEGGDIKGMMFENETLALSTLRSAPSKSHNKASKLELGDNGEINPEFAKDRPIQRIINDLLSATNWADDLGKKIKRAGTNSSEEKSSKDREKDGINEQKKFHQTLSTVHIRPQVRYDSWDPTTNDYNRTIIYHVFPYDAASQIMQSLSMNDKQKEYENKKAASLQKIKEWTNRKNFIRRKYNYLFTGKNTDILSFDLRFNNIWQSYVPYYNGDTGIDAIDSAKATKNADIVKTFGSAAKATIRNKKYLNDFIEYQADLKVKRRDVQSRQDKLKDKDKDKQQPLLDKLKELDTKIGKAEAGEKQFTKAAVRTKKIALDSAAEIDKLSRKKFTGEKYAEDLDVNLLGMIPLSITDSSEGTSNASGQAVSSGNTTGKNFFNSLLNNQYNAKARDFMHIDFEIRGDPYWLGESHIKTENALTERIALHKQDKPDGENILIIDSKSLETMLEEEFDNKNKYVPEVGEQLLLLEFKTPNGNDGLSYSESISGLWFVQTLKSKFEGGKFTQTIGSKRDPVTGQLPYSEINDEIKRLTNEHNKKYVLGEK